MKIIANTLTLGAACQLAEGFIHAGREGGRRPGTRGGGGGLVELCLVGGPAAAASPFRVYAERMLRGDYWREGGAACWRRGAGRQGPRSRCEACGGDGHDGAQSGGGPGVVQGRVARGGAWSRGADVGMSLGCMEL